MSKESGSGAFYAVASGRQTGVFESWAQSEAQTKGYSHNQHQKFSSASEAHAFVERNGGYTRSADANDTGRYFAVASGRQPGVYPSWSQAEAQVKGYAGARHQKFSTPDAANAYVKDNGKNNRGYY